MTRYISILRGINVSGQKVIKMADLKILYEKLKLNNVTTYIQSGNVVFDSPIKLKAELIENAIAKHYGFSVPVILRTDKEWTKIITSNPFTKDPDKDISKMHVVFLADKPNLPDKEKLNKVKHPSEEYFFEGTEVFLYCPNGYGKTKLSNTFLEKTLKTTATTRNWKTVNKLKEIADSIM